VLREKNGKRGGQRETAQGFSRRFTRSKRDSLRRTGC
jgi:hypothetical protein